MPYVGYCNHQATLFNFNSLTNRINTLDSLEYLGFKINSNISILLKYFFASIGEALISKPFFIFQHNKIIIQLSFYLNKNVYYTYKKNSALDKFFSQPKTKLSPTEEFLNAVELYGWGDVEHVADSKINVDSSEFLAFQSETERVAQYSPLNYYANLPINYTPKMRARIFKNFLVASRMQHSEAKAIDNIGSVLSVQANIQGNYQANNQANIQANKLKVVQHAGLGLLPGRSEKVSSSALTTMTAGDIDWNSQDRAFKENRLKERYKNTSLFNFFKRNTGKLKVCCTNYKFNKILEKFDTEEEEEIMG